MEFKSYASSSSGNCYSVSDRDTKILIECGISRGKLSKLSGFALSEFKACLLSHEHKDHAKSVQDLLERGIEVYMSAGTAEALEAEGARLVENMEQFNVGSFDVVPFTVFHDAAEPLGFLIKSRADGDVLAFATDTVNLRYKFPGLNILAIEANYDKGVLSRCEKLPEKVRHRITRSHMEIDTLCDYLSTLDLSDCREIHLLHLSDAMSREAEFIRKVQRAVPDGVRVTACGK
jgi:phosphoribosyl 1,2-cyclic phosphodiesterase